MIDHLIRFDTEDLAKADAVVGAYCIDGAWRGDVCIPGVQVWQPSADNPDGSHNFDPRFFVIIALSQQDAALSALPGCILVADRDGALRGDPGFIKQSAIPADQLGSYALEPMFLGSGYPFGAALP